MRRFFIVTHTSVYHVFFGVHNTCDIVVQKIFSQAKSKIPVGFKVKGPYEIMLSRGESGFAVLNPRQSVLKGATVIGMFPEREPAIACAQHRDLRPYDVRWSRQTNAILQKISSGHPKVLVLPPGKELAML